MKKSNKSRHIIALAIICFMLIGTLMPVGQSVNIKHVKGFDRGPTYKEMVPLKKTTFVGFDEETLVDDYAYLAAIPTAAFNFDDKIFSHPLLFFQEDNKYPDEEKYRFLNDYSGTHYLMEDWMGYCDGKLDKLTTINVDKNDLEESWKSASHTSIMSDDPFVISKEIALDEWSYSDEAVISVIEEELENPQTVTSGSVNGEINGEIGTDRFKIRRPYGPAPEYEGFQIEDEYRYVKVDLWYPAIVTLKSALQAIPGFGAAVGVTIPSVDPDLQIFFMGEEDWIQTAAASEMAITGGPHEQCFSYVYEPGDWRVGVTNMPTEGGEPFVNSGPLGAVKWYGSIGEAVKNLLFGVKDFYVDITKYPGVEIEIPETPTYGCRSAEFKLKWENEDIDLGLTLIGPSGEEIDSVLEEGTDNQEIKLHQIGECLEGEHYKVVVYALNDIKTAIDFDVSYKWEQNFTRKDGEKIDSACQGAILSSLDNNPLLYVTTDKLPQATEDALLKLGVEKVKIIDIGGYLSQETIDKIKELVDIKSHYTKYQDIFDTIKEKTNSNDIVFSTIDPWSFWYYWDSPRDLKPDGEYKGAFYFAQAAYAAVHHGTPLLLVDNHPELSSAMTWHVDFWQKNARGNKVPPIACMHFTGKKAQAFLNDIGFNKIGKESILTVAGQYDIGPTWTRVFTGIGNPGAIIGTPVDVTNHISRCIFYPQLIFENPALSSNGVELINGSKSERAWNSYKLLDFHPFRGTLARLSKKTEGLTNLVELRPSGPETFKYPILHTYGCYSHRFNERASDYWGVKYQTRTGRTPGVDRSSEEIDEGVRLKYEGKAGAFLPDLSDSEIGPFYASKAGFQNAFSTNFEITMDNLNQGVVSWYMVLHGHGGHGGWLAWWEPSEDFFANTMGLPASLAKILGNTIDTFTGSKPYEVNPWRCYDMLWGSTEEPDSATLNAKVGLLYGLTGLGKPGNNVLTSGFFKTGMDVVSSTLPFPDNLPILWMFSQRDNYHDGLIGPYSITAFLTKFHYSHPAVEVDDLLENLHSMDFHAGSCLIGCNYLQIALMRHGSVLQEMDPWSTSYWNGYAGEQTVRDYAIGKTVGETYSDGIGEIGVQYLFEEDEDIVWWWDTLENMVLFTDPDLRIWVPNAKYDPAEKNHWKEDEVESLDYDSDFNLNGHMPFGATAYPHEKQPASMLQKYFWIIILLAVIVIILIIAGASSKKKKK